MWIKKIKFFLHNKVWNNHLDKESNRLYANFLFYVRVILLSIEKYFVDACFLQAAALTFYSILVLFPGIVLLLSISLLMNWTINIQNFFQTHVPQSNELFANFTAYANSLLDKGHVFLIIIASVIVIFIAALRMLMALETGFTEIWNVFHPRSFFVRLRNYILILIIFPIVILVASSITVFLLNYLEEVKWGLFIPLANTIVWLMKLTPYFLIWCVLYFLYTFLPHQKVQAKSALIGAIIAGSLFQIVQWIHLTFQYGSTQFGNIYGVLASIIIFFAWLQVSWIIILLGAEITYGHQYARTYNFKPWKTKVSHEFEYFVGVLIVFHCIKRKAQGENFTDLSTLAHELELPLSVIEPIAKNCIKAKLVSLKSSIQEKHTHTVIEPTEDWEKLSLSDVILKLRMIGEFAFSFKDEPQTTHVTDAIYKFNQELYLNKENILIKDLIL